MARRRRDYAVEMGLVGLPLRAASRGLAGVSRIAGFPDIAESLDRRAAHVEAQLDSMTSLGRTLAQRAERILTTIERLDERAEAIVIAAERMSEVGEAITRVGAAIVEVGEMIVERGDAIIDRGDGIIDAGERIIAKGDQIVLAGEQMAAAAPSISRAVDIIAPLEGMVERLGRISDRLPGGRTTRTSRRGGDGERAVPRSETG